MKVGSKVRVSCTVDTFMSQYINMTGRIIEVSWHGETVRVALENGEVFWFYLSELEGE